MNNLIKKKQKYLLSEEDSLAEGVFIKSEILVNEDTNEDFNGSINGDTPYTIKTSIDIKDEPNEDFMETEVPDEANDENIVGVEWKELNGKKKITDDMDDIVFDPLDMCTAHIGTVFSINFINQSEELG